MTQYISNITQTLHAALCIAAASAALYIAASPQSAFTATGQGIVFQRSTITIIPKGYEASQLDSVSEKASLAHAAAEKAAKRAQDPEARIEDAISASLKAVTGKDHNSVEKTAPKEAISAPGKGNTALETPALPPREPITFNTMIRPEQSLSEEGMFQIAKLNAGESVMMVFDYISRVPLVPMNIFQPLDVLFISEYGEILKIAPNITLAYLRGALQAEQPVRAFIFMPKGSIAEYGIRPADRVEHAIFTTTPLTLQ